MAITLEELEWLNHCHQRQQEFFPRCPRDLLRVVPERVATLDKQPLRVPIGELLQRWNEVDIVQNYCDQAMANIEAIRLKAAR